MRWLCRLITPPGGIVLDTFLGSGSTGIAAQLEGFEFIGHEREPPYMAIAEARIAHATRYPDAWADTEPGADRAEAKKASEGGEERAALEACGQVGMFGSG